MVVQDDPGDSSNLWCIRSVVPAVVICDATIMMLCHPQLTLTNCDYIDRGCTRMIRGVNRAWIHGYNTVVHA